MVEKLSAAMKAFPMMIATTGCLIAGGTMVIQRRELRFAVVD
jgi:hypothetical protein